MKKKIFIGITFILIFALIGISPSLLSALKEKREEKIDVEEIGVKAEEREESYLQLAPSDKNTLIQLFEGVYLYPYSGDIDKVKILKNYMKKDDYSSLVAILESYDTSKTKDEAAYYYTDIYVAGSVDENGKYYTIYAIPDMETITDDDGNILPYEALTLDITIIDNKISITNFGFLNN